jgi:hypothetical protein
MNKPRAIQLGSTLKLSPATLLSHDTSLNSAMGGDCSTYNSDPIWARKKGDDTERISLGLIVSPLPFWWSSIRGDAWHVGIKLRW